MWTNKIDFKIGQQLRVISDRDLFQTLQQTCGGYSYLRMNHLPGTNVIVKHYSPGRVLVEKNKEEYHLHPGTLENFLDIELIEAIETGDEDKVLQLLHSENLNSQDHFGRTPFHLACAMGHTELVKNLYQFGPDVNIPDNRGYFPIHTCALNRHYDTLQFLLEQFPGSLHKKTFDGKSIGDFGDFGNHEALMSFFSPRDSVLLPSNELDETLLTLSMPPRIPETLSQKPNVINEIDKTLTTIPMLSQRPEETECDSNVIHEKLLCKICYERRIDCAIYDCGHTMCVLCSERMVICPFDRKEIIKKRCFHFNE